MINSNRTIVDFLYENTHLLDAGRVDEFVDGMNQLTSITDIGTIYAMLRKANIDILFHIGNVPEYYCYQDDEIESIVIPSNIKRIDDRAFCVCKNLKSITIPEGVENISSLSFCQLPNLSRLSLPSTLKTLGPMQTLKAIKELTLPKYVELTCQGAPAVIYCDNLETFRFNYHDKLIPHRRDPQGLLEECPNLKTIEYLEGTTAAFKVWGRNCANNRKKDLYLARSVEYIDAKLTYQDKLYMFHVYKDSKADKLLKQEHPECKVVYRD